MREALEISRGTRHSAESIRLKISTRFDALEQERACYEPPDKQTIADGGPSALRRTG